MNPQIVEAFAEMVRDKGIDRDILMSVIEETFSMMVKKKFGLESKFDIVMNMDKGDIEIYLEKSVVDVVEDPATQISVTDARTKSGTVLHHMPLTPHILPSAGCTQPLQELASHHQQRVLSFSLFWN